MILSLIYSRFISNINNLNFIKKYLAFKCINYRSIIFSKYISYYIKIYEVCLFMFKNKFLFSRLFLIKEIVYLIRRLFFIYEIYDMTPSVGDVFDLRFHKVLAQITDNFIIIRVITKCYVFNKIFVLRKSLVIIG